MIGLSPPLQPCLESERHLLACAIALGGLDVDGVSSSEKRLAASRLPIIPAAWVSAMRRGIRRGEDPLGDAFVAIRTPAQRRPLGATYTPWTIVREMLAWAKARGIPERVVDPGTGSGRFLIEAGRIFPKAHLIGVEIDPRAALLARAGLAAAGFASRSRVECRDFRSVELAPGDGRTLFVGNPPYVRHHLLSRESKEWLTAEATRRGLPASQLAGLHVHFFLATMRLARVGDYGAFITAAEWLDVNYGKLLRGLFLNGLGGQSILTIEPEARPFPDAASTAAITTFVVGSKARSIRVGWAATRDSLRKLSNGVLVSRERLGREQRWTSLLRGRRSMPEGHVELGELCRVHRGQATGANRVWIVGEHSSDLPASVLYPTITRARELFSVDGVLKTTVALRRVIDLPTDLDALPGAARSVVERFRRWAKSVGADQTYIARHRRAWWSVGLREPAPILATYMARRPPTFVLNHAQARHINIAHGLYPRERLGEAVLQRLVSCLRIASARAQGRTYAGGLIKFEPGEMERIRIPDPRLEPAHSSH